VQRKIKKLASKGLAAQLALCFLLVASLAYSSILKMEAARCSETGEFLPAYTTSHPRKQYLFQSLL
jgi:hypothetical protein